MNYEPNKIKWKVGALVIHDADRKTPQMLMKVIEIREDGIYITQYISPYMLENYHRTKDMKFENDLKELHDPERFGILLPGDEPVPDIDIQPHTRKPPEPSKMTIKDLDEFYKNKPVLTDKDQAEIPKNTYPIVDECITVWFQIQGKENVAIQFISKPDNFQSSNTEEIGAYIKTITDEDLKRQAKHAFEIWKESPKPKEGLP